MVETLQKKWWTERSFSETRYEWPVDRLIAFIRDDEEVTIAVPNRPADTIGEGNEVLIAAYEFDGEERDLFRAYCRANGLHLHIVEVKNTNKSALLGAKKKLEVAENFF